MSFVIVYSKLILIFFSNIQLLIFAAGKRTQSTRKYTTRKTPGIKINIKDHSMVLLVILSINCARINP